MKLLKFGLLALSMLLLIFGSSVSGATREEAFQSLMRQAETYLKTNPSETINLAEKAMKIPGYEDNEDAKWMVLQAKELLEKSELVDLGHDDNIYIKKKSNWSKIFEALDGSVGSVVVETYEHKVTFNRPKQGFTQRFTSMTDAEVNRDVPRGNPILAKVTFSDGKKSKSYYFHAQDIENICKSKSEQIDMKGYSSRVLFSSINSFKDRVGMVVFNFNFYAKWRLGTPLQGPDTVEYIGLQLKSLEVKNTF